MAFQGPCILIVHPHYRFLIVESKSAKCLRSVCPYMSDKAFENAVSDLMICFCMS